MQETQVPSLGWEGNGNPLQYSCLENPMDRGAQFMGLQRVGHDWATDQLALLLHSFLVEEFLLLIPSR